MPRFYFHIRSPDAFLEDELGVELRGLDDVRTAAIDGARGIMAEDLKAGRPIDHQTFEVCDEDGAIVFAIVFRDVLRFPEP